MLSDSTTGWTSTATGIRPTTLSWTRRLAPLHSDSPHGEERGQRPRVLRLSKGEPWPQVRRTRGAVGAASFETAAPRARPPQDAGRDEEVNAQTVKITVKRATRRDRTWQFMRHDDRYRPYTIVTHSS